MGSAMRAIKPIMTAVLVAAASLSFVSAQEAPAANTVAQPAPIQFRLDTSFQSRCRSNTITTDNIGAPFEEEDKEVAQYLDVFLVDGDDLVLASLSISPSDVPSLYARFGPDGEILAVEEGSYSSPQEWLIVSRTQGVVDETLLAEAAEYATLPLQGRVLVPGDLLYTPVSLEAFQRGFFAQLPAELAIELTLEDEIAFVGVEQNAEGRPVLIWEGAFTVHLLSVQPEMKLRGASVSQHRAEYDLATGHFLVGQMTTDLQLTGPDGFTSRNRTVTEVRCAIEPVSG